ncbi:hypothetical protein MIN45_P0506 [Methylomarinovum tepidoasis]|uniref:Uncharacterized protein n=1 Tax=Methylomarinovum tepidoasis TaxID=2840183 RepID=A0AAU9BXF0_9GAMM|nr:hypothetical protein [Methylomarinovum sp. IN45]BCX88138.1 hypothetical protein MIN45_P0506 [Methylomarinovum sp. IN45]
MFEKLVRNKYSMLLLAIYIVALYVILNKAIVPFVFKTLEADLFTGDPSKSGQVTEVHDNRTAMALLQCNRYVRERFDDEASLTFENKDYHSWDIGFGRFLVKSRVDVSEPGEAMIRKNYVCEIKHTGGDLADQENWKLTGLALNDVKQP